MSRHGYSDSCDGWELIRWRRQVASAISGKRGQAFLRALVAALDAMPEKRLVAGELENHEGAVCALGCLAKSRGVQLEPDDTYDWDKLSQTFDIAPQLAREVMFNNDDWCSHGTPENRWKLVRDWAAREIVVTPDELLEAT